VDSWEAVDIPKVRRLGGGVRGGSAVSASAILSDNNDEETRGAAGSGVGTSGRAGLQACWYRGDRGGDRTGREAMGEGGTNGKDSKIESARVDVVEITEVPDTRLALSRP